MNNILKNILIFGIPGVILLIIIAIAMSTLKGESSESSCPADTPYKSEYSEQCLQCDPQMLDGCKECDDVDNPCKNDGVCYKEPGWEKGVCVCPPGVSGISCEKVCSSDSKCNGGKCVDGVCVCPQGQTGKFCEEKMKIAECKPPSGCNTLMIKTLKLKYVGPNDYQVRIAIEDPNIQDDKDIPVKKGDKIYIGGFEENPYVQGSKSFASFNSWNSIPSQSYAYHISNVTGLKSNVNSSGNQQGDCYYYCPGQTSSVSCEDPQGPYTEEVCNSTRKQENGPCFTDDCLKYFVITLDLSNFTTKTMDKLGRTGVAFDFFGGINVDTLYSYINWQSGAYIHLPASDGYEQKYPPLCYSGTASTDDGQCMGCTGSWGPGQNYKDGGWYWDSFGSGGAKEGLIPTGGWCGRTKNLKPIALSTNKTVDIMDSNPNSENCVIFYGKSACQIDQNKDWCEKGGGGKLELCAVRNFWAYPGSSCQTGKWNRCNSCFSDSGQKDGLNSSVFCGIVGAKNPNHNYADYGDNYNLRCPPNENIDYLGGNSNANFICELPPNSKLN